MSEVKTFEDLEAWQACRSFRLFIHKTVLPGLMQRKEFDLSDQLKRASRSITANIAEGYGRFHYRDNYRFCSNARGSLFECLDHLIAAHDEGLIENNTLEESRTLLDHALKLLNGYMSYLKRSASTPNKPIT